MKKIFGILALAFSLVGFASFASAATAAPKAFTITVTEPSATAPAWKAGSRQIIRWKYSANPSAGSVDQVTISFVGATGSPIPAAAFGGYAVQYNTQYGAPQSYVVRSRSITVPASLAPGRYRIMVTAVSSPATGSAHVSGVTSGSVSVAAAVNSGKGPAALRFSVSCAAVPAAYRAKTDAVPWHATVVPASASDDISAYKYEWAGAVKGTGASITAAAYPTPGIKTAHIKVTNPAGKAGSATAAAQCSILILPKLKASAAVFDAARSFWDSLWPQQ